jgi:hypothetical protein
MCFSYRCQPLIIGLDDDGGAAAAFWQAIGFGVIKFETDSRVQMELLESDFAIGPCLTLNGSLHYEGPLSYT